MAKIGFDKPSLFLFNWSEDMDGVMKCGLVNSWFTPHEDEEEAGSCFTWMSTGGEIVLVWTTFLVVTNSFVTRVVPVLLETDVEVISVDGLECGCCWLWIESICFWDGMLVSMDVDLDVGKEDTNCPLFVSSVNDFPEIYQLEIKLHECRSDSIGVFLTGYKLLLIWYLDIKFTYIAW